MNDYIQNLFSSCHPVILSIHLTSTRPFTTSHHSPFHASLPHHYPQVKRNQEDGSSRGFGFVRMKDPAMQLKILNMEHVICGRRCELRSPKRVSGRLSPVGSVSWDWTGTKEGWVGRSQPTCAMLETGSVSRWLESEVVVNEDIGVDSPPYSTYVLT